MKENAEITNRMYELRERIALIEQTRTGEMQKPFYNRDYQFLSFLSREQKIYEFALLQLEWLTD